MIFMFGITPIAGAYCRKISSRALVANPLPLAILAA
jgi:hypothetical protein